MCVVCDIIQNFDKILYSPDNVIIVFPPLVLGKSTENNKISLTLLSESGTHVEIESPIVRWELYQFFKEKNILFIDYRQN